MEWPHFEGWRCYSENGALKRVQGAFAGPSNGLKFFVAEIKMEAVATITIVNEEEQDALVALKNISDVTISRSLAGWQFAGLN